MNSVIFSIVFDNIKLLYVFIPLAILVIVPFVILSIRHKKVKLFELVSLFVHLIICATMTLSLTGIKSIKEKDETMIYVLADVSSSTNNYLETMDNYITEMKQNTKAGNKLGVVAFAMDSEELVKPESNLVKLEKAQVDKSGTNFQQAFEYTMPLFKDNQKKRIILLSDGLENSGEVLSIRNMLNENQIRLDIIYVDTTLLDSIKEVQVDNVEVSPTTFKGSNSNINLYIRGNYEHKLNVTLTDNNLEVYNQEIDMYKGSKKIEIPSMTNDPGLHNYKVVIANDEDTNKLNNTYYFSQDVHEKVETLVISSTRADGEHIQGLISDEANVTIEDTLHELKTDIKEYIKYDQIILSNVSFNVSSSDNDYEKLMNLFETLVSKYGKNLIVLGGKNSYFDGGYYQNKIKDMLPVNLNPLDSSKRTALILLIDNSGSMDGNRIEMAKKGAIASLDLLSEKDYAGIITFSDNTSVVQPLSSALFNDYTKSRIENIRCGDGTMMTPGLQEAYMEMKALKESVSNKQIILLSDGMPSDSGQLEIAQKMATEGIVLSTINIGGTYGENLLLQLSDATGGNNYTITNPNKIPEILLKEVSELTIETIIDDQVLNVEIKEPNDEIITTYNATKPTIIGLNYSKAKPTSTTVFSTSVTLSDGRVIEDVPIYSYWNYGSGKVSAFMSDISEWGKTFFESSNGKNLLKSFLKTNYPSNINRNIFTYNYETKVNQSKLVISVDESVSMGNMSIKVTDSNENVKEYDTPAKSRKFVYTIDTPIEGNYTIDVSYVTTQGPYSVFEYNDSKVINFSYSIEYDDFYKRDNILLWQLINKDELVTNDINKLMNIVLADGVYYIYYYKYLLIGSIILFVIDVAIRMIRMKDLKNIFTKAKH